MESVLNILFWPIDQTYQRLVEDSVPESGPGLKEFLFLYIASTFFLFLGGIALSIVLYLVPARLQKEIEAALEYTSRGMPLVERDRAAQLAMAWSSALYQVESLGWISEDDGRVNRKSRRRKPPPGFKAACSGFVRIILAAPLTVFQVITGLLWLSARPLMLYVLLGSLWRIFPSASLSLRDFVSGALEFMISGDGLALLGVIVAVLTFVRSDGWGVRKKSRDEYKKSENFQAHQRLARLSQFARIIDELIIESIVKFDERARGFLHDELSRCFGGALTYDGVEVHVDHNQCLIGDDLNYRCSHFEGESMPRPGGYRKGGDWTVGSYGELRPAIEEVYKAAASEAYGVKHIAQTDIAQGGAGSVAKRSIRPRELDSFWTLWRISPKGCRHFLATLYGRRGAPIGRIPTCERFEKLESKASGEFKRLAEKYESTIKNAKSNRPMSKDLNPGEAQEFNKRHSRDLDDLAKSVGAVVDRYEGEVGKVLWDGFIEAGKASKFAKSYSNYMRLGKRLWWFLR